jgi:AhpD family alkylhydroperoxidase
MNIVENFNDYRKRMNEKILDVDNLVIKRIFNLDTVSYQEGSLDARTKELLGLASSLVLRCDDCVKYHLGRCHEMSFTKNQIFEAMSVGLLIGGTIVIPHLRKAAEYWEELERNVSERP